MDKIPTLIKGITIFVVLLCIVGITLDIACLVQAIVYDMFSFSNVIIFILGLIICITSIISIILNYKSFTEDEKDNPS